MDYPALITAISDAHRQAQAGAAGAVNRHLVFRNWLIGAHLVEFEQSGEDRAEYGAGLLKRVSADLREREVPGASPDMLERMRLLYLHYPQMAERISAPLVRKLPAGEVATPGSDISAPAVRNSGDCTPRPLPIEKLLELSWTHLADLVRLEDPWKRAFYENECLKGHWSKRQLQRQIGSLLYERSGLSTDKETVIERARQQAMETPGQIADLIRDPYILEFTGLTERPHYLEADLEKALLDHLQSFLLELGTGFCFEARQRRITVGNEHDYLDPVFYHRILRCHLLIDLKIRPFRHVDAGQIHPVRYHAHHERVLLRLRSAQSQRRSSLHRLHLRLEKPGSRARLRTCGFDEGATSARTHLLRGMPRPARRDETREVSQDRLGKTIPQDASSRLSHGVHPMRYHAYDERVLLSGRLSHGVNFYLNYWKDQVMAEGDHPPVGLLLCTDKDQTKVEYATGGLDHQLFVSRYLVALPKP